MPAGTNIGQGAVEAYRAVLQSPTYTGTAKMQSSGRAGATPRPENVTQSPMRESSKTSPVYRSQSTYPVARTSPRDAKLDTRSTDGTRPRAKSESRRRPEQRPSNGKEASGRAIAPPSRQQARRSKSDTPSVQAPRQGASPVKRPPSRGNSTLSQWASAQQKQIEPKASQVNAPAAGEGPLRWQDHPKKPINAQHYRNYCACMYDFAPPPRKQAPEGYIAGIMPSKQFDQVKEHLGSVMATKYKTCRRAFRLYDENCSGTVDRGECRQLFEAHGYNQTSADRFFNRMDADHNGTVEFDNFIHVFAPFIQPETETKGLGDYKDIKSTMTLYHNDAVLHENKCASAREMQQEIMHFGAADLSYPDDLAPDPEWLGPAF